MGWDKNTSRSGDIDTTIKVLKELGEDYSLEVLGEVIGYGLNDDYAKTNKHQIRKLSYKDNVIIEQMVRSEDCDSDDVIISKNFKKDKVPDKLELEITIEEDY